MIIAPFVKYVNFISDIKGRWVDRGTDLLLPSKSQSLVLDCTGSAEGLSRACDLVRPRGTIVLKTTIAGSRAIDLNRLVIDEITLVGSRCGPFRPALDALAAGTVQVRGMIDRTYPLESGAEAFGHVREHRPLKVLLRMGG